MLVAQRDKLVKKLEAMDAEFAAMGIDTQRLLLGGHAVRPPRQERNEPHRSGQGRAEGRQGDRHTRCVAALPSVGFVSHSPNFPTMVNATLLKKNLFKRVGRGRYSLK